MVTATLIQSSNALLLELLKNLDHFTKGIVMFLQHCFLYCLVMH